VPPKHHLPPGYDPQKDRIEIAPYDPSWPSLYALEEAALRKALPQASGLLIEHIGSTSIPGLAAKPIIDIMMALESRERWPQLIQPLESISFIHGKDAFDEYHWFFVKGMPPYGERRTHQIHLMEYQSPLWKEHLAFRDYLKNHVEDARRYETLKKELAVKFSIDREAYTEAKTDFIKGVLQKISHQ